MRHLSNWIELPARDIARASAFYERVLRTQLIRSDFAGSQYAIFPAQNRYNAGALVQGEGYVPSDQGALVYLDGRGEIDAILARVVEAGGSVLLARTELGGEAGEIALFRDSEGNRVGLQSALPADSKVSDETMRGLLASQPPVHAFLLRKGPRYGDTQELQWEHARNMFALMRKGELRYVCALLDGTDVLGFGVLDAPTREAASARLAEDPGVRGGRLVVEMLSAVAFASETTRV